MVVSDGGTWLAQSLGQKSNQLNEYGPLTVTVRANSHVCGRLIMVVLADGGMWLAYSIALYSAKMDKIA